MRVAIVGAGFSGIGMAIALRRAGHEDVTILERSSDIGGVWHHNTYPGAACDVPSYLYSFTDDQRRDWTRPCSPQPEILDYLHHTARRHGVASRVRTDTEVTRADFDERALTWTLTTAAGERVEVDALVLACGQLSRPRLPDIPGMADFAGPSFHSAEWDHSVALAGKRVAVVGTGASAVQFVPEVAKRAARVDVYQRTPPWILPRRNNAYAPWAHAAIRRIPGMQKLRRAAMLAFMESGIASQTRVRPLALSLWAWSSWHMRRQVKDPELRRRLAPGYPIGCKRVLFTSHYLPALQRPNVELVDDRIECVTERGVVTADGRERAVDAIVYGTGFDAHAFVAPMAVTGAGGRTLAGAWADGAEAHHGVTVAGFPNLFLLYGPNTNLGFGSIIVMVEAQIAYVLDALRCLEATGATALDVRPEVQRASGEELQRRLRHSVWTSCRSWYRTDGDGRVVNNWPGQMAEYVRLTRRVDLADYRELRAPSRAGG
ncbi:MAG: NAD(P)/FAD-dependent oxidoreductase [Actinomycetota bacterium]|nr:NAD(P)/FAD-dependent oxidoreductase [Actinomycetota bacterium]